MESDTVQMFLDHRITLNQYSEKLAMHVRTQTSALGDTLNRFKQSFNMLSGKEVDQITFDVIEKFKSFLNENNKTLIKLKSVVERQMSVKVECDNNKIKVMQALGNLEQMLTAELNTPAFRMRADQRMLDKYTEVAN